MQEIIKRVAARLELSEQVVEKTYKAFWLFIRQKISELPLKDNLTEEEFNKLRTNFNLPSLGKLSCDYERYEKVKKAEEYRLKNINKDYNDYQKNTTSFQ